MAVKCNTPNLAIELNRALIYGFSCKKVSQSIVQTYIEYLNCQGVDYAFCSDFPCEESEGEVFCFIDDVNLTLGIVTINTASISFTSPAQPYVIELIKIIGSAGYVVDTKQSPSSPISYTGLIPNTNYNVKFTLLCEGGEIKIEEVPFLTLPDCVIIEDYTGEASDVNEYI